MIQSMRLFAPAIATLMCACGGAGDLAPASSAAATTPQVETCTIDGQAAANCYASSKGGGAVFGLVLTRGTLQPQNPQGSANFFSFSFEASTLARGASTFPAPNNDMNYAFGMNPVFCDGAGSATWTDDGTMFCVTTTAVCEASSPTVHVACVPSPLPN